MVNKQIHDLKECNIYYQEGNKILKVIWKPQPMLDARFKELLKLFADTVSKYPSDSIFVDARNHKHAILSETQKWHDKVIVSRYVNAGVKRMAFITSKSMTSELCQKSIFDKEKAKSTLDIRFFDSEEKRLNF